LIQALECECGCKYFSSIEAVLKSRSWTRKRNNEERLFEGEAYRLTGYGIIFIEEKVKWSNLVVTLLRAMVRMIVLVREDVNRLLRGLGFDPAMVELA
jgi:hypothetical protein